MNPTERAYEALGSTRSDLARYKRGYDAQQKRIKELEALLKDVHAYWYKPRTTGKSIDGIELRKDIEAAILKGAK